MQIVLKSPSYSNGGPICINKLQVMQNAALITLPQDAHKTQTYNICMTNTHTSHTRAPTAPRIIFQQKTHHLSHPLHKHTTYFTTPAPQTVGKETIAFGLHFAFVFPLTDRLNGYVTNTAANIHVALSSHRNNHLYITYFHAL